MDGGNREDGRHSEQGSGRGHQQDPRRTPERQSQQASEGQSQQASEGRSEQTIQQTPGGQHQQRGGRTQRRQPRQGGGTRQTSILSLNGVRKCYRTGDKVLTALEQVNFRVDPGEFVTIMGPSGSGKTTMLNILGLLDKPTSGTVHFMGHDVTDFDDEQRTRQRRQTIGFVFQDFYLLESLTARENVEVPAMFASGRSKGSSERAKRLLELVGLGDRLDHYPNELSGGQQQRVAIARSLINDPQVVLADEPTGNLDGDTSHQILDLLSRICNTGAAVVAVTHDPLVAEYAERQVNVIDGDVIHGQGRR